MSNNWFNLFESTDKLYFKNWLNSCTCRSSPFPVYLWWYTCYFPFLAEKVNHFFRNNKFNFTWAAIAAITSWPNLKEFDNFFQRPLSKKIIHKITSWKDIKHTELFQIMLLKIFRNTWANITISRTKESMNKISTEVLALPTIHINSANKKYLHLLTKLHAKRTGLLISSLNKNLNSSKKLLKRKSEAKKNIRGNSNFCLWTLDKQALMSLTKTFQAKSEI